MVQYFRTIISSKSGNEVKESVRKGESVIKAVTDSMTPQGAFYNDMRRRHYQELAEMLGVKGISIGNVLNGPDWITINFGDIFLIGDAFPRELVENMYDALKKRGSAFIRYPDSPLPDKDYHWKYEIAVLPGAPGIEPEMTISVSTGKRIRDARYGAYAALFTLDKVRKLQSTKGEEYVEVTPSSDSIVLRRGLFGFGRKEEPLYEAATLHDEKRQIKVSVSRNQGCITVYDEKDIDNPDVAHALDAVVEHLFEKTPRFL